MSERKMPLTRDHERLQELLSEHADSELTGAARDEVLAHLEICDDCRLLLEDFRALRREARALPSPEPPEKVWQAVSRAISGSRRARVTRALVPYFALAAAILLGVGLWLGLQAGAPAPSPATADDQAALVDMVTEELRAADDHYTKAIDGLEQIIAQNDGVLPAELQATLNENLDLIEQAIQDSRSAIRSEPTSTVAQESLLSALRRKVSLLQNTILLINEIRKGEGDNARDLIDEMRKSNDPANPI